MIKMMNWHERLVGIIQMTRILISVAWFVQRKKGKTALLLSGK